MPTFHIDGLKELAEAMAEELPKATSTNVVKRALGRAADPIEQDAQAAAPHLTGKLQRSFTTSSKLSPHQREVTVKESKVEVYVGPAALVQAITSEFGTAHQAPRPFMRPAWDNNKLGALNSIKEDLEDEINKARDRIARKALKAAQANKK
jgi:HK97 gp10 family phage protein